MGDLIKMQPPKRGLESLSHEDLLAKARELCAQVNKLDKGLQAIAEAVFPQGDSERPCDLDDMTPEQIIEGVKSLHDISDRTFGENDFLREQLLALGYTGPGRRPA